MQQLISAVCIGLVFCVAGLTQSHNASAGSAGAVFSGARVTGTTVRPEVVAQSGNLLWKRGLGESSSPKLQPNLAVVPILFNAGAALFPTIMAALASAAAAILNPRTLVPLLRRHWRRAAAVMAALALVIVGILLVRQPAVSRSAARGGALPGAQIDWAKVAEDLIAQEKLHQASGTAETIVAAPLQVPGALASSAPINAPVGVQQDLSHSLSEGSVSPAGLKPVWSFQPEDGLFLGTPAISGKRIYVSANQTDLGGYTGLLAALDLDTGRPIWQVTEIGKDALPPFFSSPAVTADGKYVIIGQGLHQDRNASLLCFEAATGKLHWAVKTPLHIESSPAIFGDIAVVGAGAVEGSDGKPAGDPGYVFAVRISDGKQLWKHAVNDPESSPAIDGDGIVYIGSGFNGRAVVALRSGSDEELQAQKLDRVVWRTSLAYPITAPVTLAGDLVIAGGGNGDMVHSDKNPQGLVVALNRKTGEIVWQTKFEDSVLGRIAVRDGVMICPSRTGEVAALAVADGRVLWRSRVSGSAPVLAGAVLTSERAYVVSSDGYLVAFEASTGKMLEKIYLNDQRKPGTGLSLASPRIVGNRIIVGSETGGLRALLGTSGTSGPSGTLGTEGAK